jgi:RNA polymerase sigma-70 factor (family 1)
MDNATVNAALNNDPVLMMAISNKDRKVFETFYKKYYKQLFALAYRYVGQAEVAEEIVHDLFINIWNKAGQLNIQYSMKSYLFRAIVNSSLNFIKKERMDAEKRLAYVSVHENDQAAEENQANEEQLLVNLEEALNLLPPKCKEIMYLSRFGKLKQQEIADQLDISLKTVKNHLTYGFQKLREQLEKRGPILLSILLLLKVIIH